MSFVADFDRHLSSLTLTGLSWFVSLLSVFGCLSLFVFTASPLLSTKPCSFMFLHVSLPFLFLVCFAAFPCVCHGLSLIVLTASPPWLCRRRRVFSVWCVSLPFPCVCVRVCVCVQPPSLHVAAAGPQVYRIVCCLFLWFRCLLFHCLSVWCVSLPFLVCFTAFPCGVADRLSSMVSPPTSRCTGSNCPGTSSSARASRRTRTTPSYSPAASTYDGVVAERGD